MKILLTNDDGIYAEGLLAAAEVLKDFGQLIVIAPEKQQSAVSHKITLHKPLRIKKILLKPSFESYALSGTPADCVKLAVNHLIKGPIDLVVSGINLGSNSGYNMVYSGTVAGAVEGMINHIPAIAISLAAHNGYCNFELSQVVLRKSVQYIQKNGLDPYVFLNINVPPLDLKDYRGTEVCRLSKNRYAENFEERTDPGGQKYYWMGGRKIETEDNPEVDDVAIQNNKVAIVPVKFEFNDQTIVNKLKTWSFED